MIHYWCTFRDRDSGTITADDMNGVRKVCAELKVTLESADRLPYPAAPQLNQSGIPSFCIQPEQCKGRGSCPRRRSCVD